MQERKVFSFSVSYVVVTITIITTDTNAEDRRQKTNINSTLVNYCNVQVMPQLKHLTFWTENSPPKNNRANGDTTVQS